MSTSKLMDDAIVDAVANRILERLQSQSSAHASVIINEVINNRKTTQSLATRISLLESAIEKQVLKLEKLSQEKQSIREMATKALEVLNTAKKELGLP